MSVGLADTSVFVAAEHDRPIIIERIPGLLRVSVVTIAELRAGVLMTEDLRNRESRLETYARALQLEPIPVTLRVAEIWARLRGDLATMGSRMPVNDSWIAATAMTFSLPVVTQDGDYPDGIPGLDVIRV